MTVGIEIDFDCRDRMRERERAGDREKEEQFVMMECQRGCAVLSLAFSLAHYHQAAAC